MARNRQPIMKQCRKFGISPMVLGINKKSNRQSDERRKISEYGIQLQEKQKVKFIYGMLEKQFNLYYKEADKREGVTGELLLTYLEQRLDNVVFRAGFAQTRKQARQIVNHGHIEVNGKRVNIPSYRVSQEDIISVKEKSKKLDIIKEAVGSRKAPAWLELDEEKMQVRVVELPKKEYLDFEVNEQLIVEFYSR
ncbi:MAG: 30S ribosomal protein S4 [Fusobacteriota bacterium]